MEKETPDDKVDLLVDEALSELGAAALEPPDEYTELCEFAGCYPWLDDIDGIVQAHPHDAALLASLRGDVTEPDPAERPAGSF